MLGSSLAIAGVVGLSTSSFAGTCDVKRLERFVGTWSARGDVQADPDAAKEPIRCRIVFSTAGKARIETAGRCASTSQTRDVQGWLACDGSNFVGPLFVIADEAAPTFLGDVSDDTEIRLALEAPLPTTGEIEHYRLNVSSLSPNTMVMRGTRGPFTFLNLRYSRQDP